MAELEHRALGDGAAETAPTAPHATPRSHCARRTGPERFWSSWRVRIAFAACMVVSGLAHCAIVPVDARHDFEVKDVEGVADIPIDVLEGVETPAPPEEPAPAAGSPGEEPKSPEQPLAAASRRDAGALADAGPDAAADAASDARADAAGIDGAVAAATDAGPGGSGPKDPEAIIGAAGAVQADRVLVMVVVNAEVIRKNPEGSTIGSLLRGVPQWSDFMSGTGIDPVRDIDWIMISGPSLVNTSRDVVLVRYGAPDALVDRTMDAMSARYAQGGPVDTGVPHVHAVRSFADHAERIMVRPQAHLLAIVPPAVAPKTAQVLSRAAVPAHVRPGEALYVRVFDPHHPMPELPSTITELRMRIVPRPDDGADIYLEGDTKDADTAAQAASDVRGVIERHNDMLVSMATLGLLDHVEVGSTGSLVRAHVVASRDQIATIIRLVAGMLGVPLGSAAAPTGSGATPRMPR